MRNSLDTNTTAHTHCEQQARAGESCEMQRVRAVTVVLVNETYFSVSADTAGICRILKSKDMSSAILCVSAAGKIAVSAVTCSRRPPLRSDRTYKQGIWRGGTTMPLDTSYGYEPKRCAAIRGRKCWSALDDRTLASAQPTVPCRSSSTALLVENLVAHL